MYIAWLALRAMCDGVAACVVCGAMIVVAALPAVVAVAVCGPDQYSLQWAAVGGETQRQHHLCPQ